MNAYNELVSALMREQTPDEKQRVAISYASYQAFAAGVRWGAEHGRGEWDDAAQAWDDWLDTREEGAAT